MKKYSVNGWKRESPNHRQRTKMLKNCGKKCFLDPFNKAYPICKKNTCKISKKGILAAYIRSRQYKKSNISRKAKKLMNK